MDGKPEPWWPLEWDSTEPFWAYAEGHPVVGCVTRSPALRSTNFHPKSNRPGDPCAVSVREGVLRSTSATDLLTIRCILLELAYPEGNP